MGAVEIKATEPGAAYTGLALATTTGGAQQLYQQATFLSCL